MRGGWTEWRGVGMRASLLARLCVLIGTKVHERALSLQGPPPDSAERESLHGSASGWEKQGRRQEAATIRPAAALKRTATGSHPLF